MEGRSVGEEASPIIKRSADLQTLENINRRVRAISGLEDVMNFVYDEIGSSVPRDRMGLALIGEAGKFVTAHWARTEAEVIHLKPGYVGELKGSSLERVFETGEPRILNNLPYYLRNKPESHSTQLIVEEGMKSSLTVPLKVDERAVGFLFVSSRAIGAYNEQHVKIALRLTEAISQAVEKAYLIARLKNLNQNYIETIGFVAHEMKSPIANIASLGMLFAKGYLGDLTEKQKHTIDRIVQNAKFTTELINHYLNLTRVEREGLLFEPKDGVDFITGVVEPITEIYKNQIEEHQSELVKNLPEDPPVIECDSSLLQIVLGNLVGNAIKYGAPKCRIELSVWVEGGWLYTSVWNEGVGFPPEKKQRLFRKFSRLKVQGTEKAKGTGLGLYLSYLSILRHGGEMWADSEFGQWASFSFKIPLRLSEEVKHPEASIQRAYQE